MDLLDRVAGPGGLLLDDVDSVLDQCGTPAGHPIVGLMRSVGARPSAVLAAVEAFDPDAITDAADRLKATANAVGDAIDEVPLPTASAGAAAEHFAAAWRNLAGQVSGTTAPSDADCLVGRLAVTADHLAALATWASDARRELAIEVGTCLGSSEAVVLRSALTSGSGAGAITVSAGAAGAALSGAAAVGAASAAGAAAGAATAVGAAADIGARILAVAARLTESGWNLHAAGRDLTAEVRLQPYDITTTASSTHIEIR